MFTLKQIEEIAAKLALLAVKDSQFEEIDYPLNSTESVPILQDGANRRIPFAEFVNIIVGNDDTHLNIPCSLTVTCNTPDATILIGGQTRSNNSYTGHYGEVVNVKVSKEGFDTYYESVTLTNNTSLVITLNQKGGDYDADLADIRQEIANLRTEILGLLANMGITFVSDSSGTYYTIRIGDDSVNVYSKEQIDAMMASGGDPTPVDPDASPYLYFEPADDITLSSNGETVTNVKLKTTSTTSWVITAKELPSEASQDSSRNAPVNFGPKDIKMEEGKSSQLYETN